MNWPTLSYKPFKLKWISSESFNVSSLIPSTRSLQDTLLVRYRFRFLLTRKTSYQPQKPPQMWWPPFCAVGVRLSPSTLLYRYNSWRPCALGCDIAFVPKLAARRLPGVIKKSVVLWFPVLRRLRGRSTQLGNSLRQGGETSRG